MIHFEDPPDPHYGEEQPPESDVPTCRACGVEGGCECEPVRVSGPALFVVRAPQVATYGAVYYAGATKSEARAVASSDWTADVAAAAKFRRYHEAHRMIRKLDRECRLDLSVRRVETAR